MTTGREKGNVFMPELSQKYTSVLILLLGISVGCDSPHGIEEGFVEDLTARFDGLEAELIHFNYSWVPREGSVPDEDSVFMTLQVEVRNDSAEPRSVEPENFEIRTLLAGRASEGPTWSVIHQGRDPRLVAQVLEPGEESSGWLTFQVPKGLYAEELIWIPAPTSALTIVFPSGPVDRLLDAIVFGKVTDPNGSPVSGARVLVTPVHPPFFPGDTAMFGDCEGHPARSVEALTSSTGRYQISILGGSSSLICVDVQVSAPPASELADARVGGATVVPVQESSGIMELPEVRVDVRLSR